MNAELENLPERLAESGAVKIRVRLGLISGGKILRTDDGRRDVCRRVSPGALLSTSGAPVGVDVLGRHQHARFDPLFGRIPGEHRRLVHVRSRVWLVGWVIGDWGLGIRASKAEYPISNIQIPKGFPCLTFN